MPPFFKPRFYYRNRYRHWKRPWRSRRRRSRRAFQRKRRRRVRKRFYIKKRKLKKLKIVQWQPETIRKCHIKGYFTLFEAAQGRFSNNFAQFQDSITPQHEPGGGGWGTYVFNLGALFQQFERVRNYWTYSNVGLPLVRYCGCKFYFYRSDFCDYIVKYNLNYPMTDSELVHSESQPLRMLLSRHKIIVTKKTERNKPYKVKKIRPPRQLINKWFFQRETVNVNFLMLTATAASLSQFSCSSNEQSNNISFEVLNPRVFQNLNFNTLPTYGYKPNPNWYLYGTISHEGDTPPSIKDLIYLGNTNLMKEGTPPASKDKVTEYLTKSDLWGNPFFDHYLNGNYQLWVSTQQPSGIYTTTNWDSGKANVQKMSEPLLIPCRYAPNLDTGYSTICFLISNFKNNNGFNPPENEQLTHSGFPLWDLFWGWLDWQQKLAIVQQVKQHYMVAFKSPHVTPKLDIYIPLDQEFITNHHLYLNDEAPLLSDQLSWHPKSYYQQHTLENICMCGPATAKNHDVRTIQANCKYDFFFKWGGSPSEMETIANPSKQPAYPVPDKLATGIQIQDPAYDPRQYIFNWDIRRDLLTSTATKRILKDYTTESTLLFPTEQNLSNPNPPKQPLEQTIQTLLQTQDSEKEKEKMEQLIRQFQSKQQQLRDQLNNLLKQRLNLQ